MENNTSQTLDYFNYQNQHLPYSIHMNPIVFGNHMENTFSSNESYSESSDCASSLSFISSSIYNTTKANINELNNETISSNGSVSSLPEDKSEKYFEKRKKNNESAKRSRLARIKREQDLMIKVLLLEKENLALNMKVDALTEELTRNRPLFS